jgi:predicted GNAT family acetyltransferase
MDSSNPRSDSDRMEHKAVTIEREELNGSHEFVLRIDGQRLGFLEYTRPDVGVMRIEYVEVSPELRGTGLGKQLVEKAVAFATDAKLRVVPICSYARAVIHRDPALSAALK